MGGPRSAGPRRSCASRRRRARRARSPPRGRADPSRPPAAARRSSSSAPPRTGSSGRLRQRTRRVEDADTDVAADDQSGRLRQTKRAFLPPAEVVCRRSGQSGPVSTRPSPHGRPVGCVPLAGPCLPSPGGAGRHPDHARASLPHRPSTDSCGEGRGDTLHQWLPMASRSCPEPGESQVLELAADLPVPRSTDALIRRVPPRVGLRPGDASPAPPMVHSRLRRTPPTSTPVAEPRVCGSAHPCRG